MAQLALGTASFGMKYPKDNQISKDEAFKILDYAIENGIDFIDTAAAYGNAEELLGEYGIKYEKVNVISKLIPNFNGNFQEVRDKITESRDKLKTKPWAYLIHAQDKIYDLHTKDGLAREEGKGFILNKGISVYSLKNAFDSIEFAKVIQYPYSVFDQTFDSNRFQRRAKNNNIILFARQPFLKGFLLQGINEILPQFTEKGPNFKEKLIKFEEICFNHNLAREEACLMFSLSSQADYVVFGVDSVEQLKQNIEIYNRWKQSPQLFDKCREELVREFGDMTLQIPSLWAKEQN